jgi:hypothetical protein
MYSSLLQFETHRKLKAKRQIEHSHLTIRFCFVSFLFWEHKYIMLAYNVGSHTYLCTYRHTPTTTLFNLRDLSFYNLYQHKPPPAYAAIGIHLESELLVEVLNAVSVLGALALVLCLESCLEHSLAALASLLAQLRVLEGCLINSNDNLLVFFVLFLDGNSHLLYVKIDLVASGHNVVVVDALHERLELAAASNLLLAHRLGHLARVSVNTSNYGCVELFIYRCQLFV